MNDHELLELTGLCNALADGRLSGRDGERLNAVLAGSEEARRFYIRYSGLSSSLCSYAAELQTGQAEKVVRFPRAARWTAAALAIAASVALALIPDWRGQDAPEPDSVAWLTGSQDAEWGGAPLAAGDALERGQRVELRRGLAEVTFDSGARVVLEGPASLDVQTAWSAGLRSGSLTASTSAEAAGFHIVNAAVDVTNLGGEIGMTADGDGGTEVYAIRGSAETGQPGGGAKLLLKDRQARRFARDGVTNVKDSERKLAKLASRANLERRRQPINFARWSFDDTLIAQTAGFSAPAFTAKLEGGGAAMPLQPGRWRRGLTLDGRSFASAHMPGENPRTVAFWVKVPADAPLGAEVAMLAWKGKGRGQLRPGQITWNRDPEHGALGALRTDHEGSAAVVGRTSLRDGQWHHVAVLFLGAKKNRGMSQVKQYVDGRLDGTGAFALRGKNAAPSTDASGTVWIGRRAGARGIAQEGFRGELDELFIGDRPLAPGEIRQLMESNETPGGA